MEQQHTVDDLWRTDGHCVCGRPILSAHPKLCLAQVNSSWSPLVMARNTLAIGLYCGRCSDIINMTLKNLRPLPEDDKLKHQAISGH